MSERRRALITGAAARLGRAMALDLAASGWDIAVHYNTSAGPAEGTVADIRALGANAVGVKADLLDRGELESLVDRSADGLGGPLSLLINNASLFENDNAKNLDRTGWDRAIDSNLWGPVVLTRDFANQAPKATRDANAEPLAQAVVINMLDQRVLKPTPHFQSYFIAKSGLYAFTRTAAQSLAPDIRVAAIGPGPTLEATHQSGNHFARQRAACILGRGSDPEDIVGAMRFILSNKAFTGQMLAIDGGQHLSWQTPDVIGSGA
ncbi:MAG: SDR family oxidoreductase [Pseudomonadota bacterium]